jgi:hypothetical protein
LGRKNKDLQDNIYRRHFSCKLAPNSTAFSCVEHYLPLSNPVTVLPDKHPTRDCPNDTPAQRNLPYLVNINLSDYTMVFSAPAPGVGSSKRPASCMQDDVNGWDNVPVSNTGIGKTYMDLTHLLHSQWVYPCVH